MLLITTPTTTPSLVKTSLYCSVSFFVSTAQTRKTQVSVLFKERKCWITNLAIKDSTFAFLKLSETVESIIDVIAICQSRLFIRCCCLYKMHKLRFRRFWYVTPSCLRLVETSQFVYDSYSVITCDQLQQKLVKFSLLLGLKGGENVWPFACARVLERRRLCLVNNEFMFFKLTSPLSRSVQCVNGSKSVLKLHVQRRRSTPNGNTKN